MDPLSAFAAQASQPITSVPSVANGFHQEVLGEPPQPQEAIEDPLQGSFHSQQGSALADSRQEQEEASENDEVLDSQAQLPPPTSSVFNLASYSLEGLAEEGIQEDESKASKQQDMSGKTFISYLIHTNLPSHKMESKHRYSDFESLRAILVQSYPFVAVPPIPDKHSVGTTALLTLALYAAKPGKAQQDPAIIAKRKRLLQSFLNRLLVHPILRRAHELHLFLRGEAVWSDVVHGSPIRKKPSMMIENATMLRKPDPHFTVAQDYTVRFGNQLSFIRKIQKKLVAQYQEVSSVYMELGALYNGWSLTEQGLSESIEQMGQAVDSTLTATTILKTSLEERFGDILTEYNKFSTVLVGVLGVRHRAHVEFEQISERLILKQQALHKLESSEHEAQRLAAVLSVEGGPQVPMARPSGFMAQINALLDNDPDTTRRVTISKTKDTIAQLEVAREESRTTLLALNAKIQRDLDRFQRQKVRDLRDLMVALSLAQREYNQRAIAAWQGAKAAIERIA
ncbi:Sorting nexin, cytoplasm-to-vacuole targeting pathway/endosomal sorting [Kappamyces sp. JEL0680]|nr:Sorting nexin, cytoplasm-to-vacuole targeting pathway/endosomal sorting [Kappamyces sp. JEL0680]